MSEKPASASAPAQGRFVREFGLTAAIILVVSSIIGSGVYKKIAPMALELQAPGLVLLAWGLAGLVTLLGVLSAAEISGMITDAGGPYAYFRVIYGRHFAYFYGWSSFSVIQSASIASIAYVFAQSLNAVAPLPRLGGVWEEWEVLGLFTPLANIGVKLAAAAAIVTLAAINYRGVKEGGWVSKVITVLVVASILIIILLGLSISGGSLSNALTPASDYDPAAFNSGLGMAGVLFAAMLGAFWAYEGWLNLGFIGEEVKDPQRNIPLGLIIGILIVIAVYLAINFTYLYVIPMDEMIALAANENTIMAVVAVERFLGTPGLWFISLLIVITTLGCTNTTILSAARIYYAMARNGQFARAAHRLHPRHNTPAGALVMQGIWSSLLVFSGTFDQLTDMLIFASFIFYGAIVFGVFVLRRRMPAAERPYRAIGYPIVPALFIVFCVALVIVTCIQQPREAFLGLFLIAMGTPFYVYWLRRYEQR